MRPPDGSAAPDREARRIEHAAAFGVNPEDVSDEVLDRDPPAARNYRKRPVVIEAFQWTGDYDLLEGILGLNWGRADAKDVAWEHEDGEEVVIYNSAEKVWIPVPLDHWIVRGVRGEFYPVDPAIFEETYEPA